MEEMRLFLVLLIITCVSAANIRSLRPKEKIKAIKCDEKEHLKCLVWNNSSQGCYPIDCWKFNAITEKCERDGKPWLPAIILQSIPITGIFGSGFGNIGRWDIFGVYLGLLIIPFALICCCMCYILSKEDISIDQGFAFECCRSFLTCTWAFTVLFAWIYGIVAIASKNIEAPWVSYDGTPIMCPLVD